MDTRPVCREIKAYEIATYMIKHNLTISDTAKHFNMNMPTVKKYVNELLKEVSFSLWMEVQEHIKKVTDVK
jgi:hypothetical protein